VAESNSDEASISGPQIRAARALLKWSVGDRRLSCKQRRGAADRGEYRQVAEFVTPAVKREDEEDWGSPRWIRSKH
jgi:hypothetical protein